MANISLNDNPTALVDGILEDTYEFYKKTTIDVSAGVIDSLPTTGTGYSAKQTKFTTAYQPPPPPTRGDAQLSRGKLGRRRGGGAGFTERDKAKNRVKNQINRLKFERFKRLAKSRKNGILGWIVVNSWYSQFIKPRNKGYQRLPAVVARRLKSRR